MYRCDCIRSLWRLPIPYLGLSINAVKYLINISKSDRVKHLFVLLGGQILNNQPFHKSYLWQSINSISSTRVCDIIHLVSDNLHDLITDPDAMEGFSKSLNLMKMKTLMGNDGLIESNILIDQYNRLGFAQHRETIGCINKLYRILETSSHVSLTQILDIFENNTGNTETSLNQKLDELTEPFPPK